MVGYRRRVIIPSLHPEQATQMTVPEISIQYFKILILGKDTTLTLTYVD
jgi:hypothetical protein